MDLLSYEDFPPGWARQFGAYRLSREEIVAFAREFDPQPFHLDDEEGAASLLGGIAASGWHSFSIMMRLYCDEWLLRSMSMGSPGVSEARWLAPVRPDDVLSVRMRVEDARVSQSRPEIGLLTISSEVLNQTGAVVAQASHVNMLGRRGFALDGRQAKPSLSPQAAAQPAPLDQARPPGRAPFDCFENVVVGSALALGEHLFLKEDIIRFARAYDPQLFHLDEAAAERGPFGRLAASGWHTASAFMRKLVDARRRVAQQAQDRGQAPLTGGPSPGFRDLRWLKPVYAGDTIAYSTTPTSKRRTTRPGWGLVFAHNVGVNQTGEKVFEFSSAVFFPTRDSGFGSIG